MKMMMLCFAGALLLAAPHQSNAVDSSIVIEWQRKILDSNMGKATPGQVAKSTEDCIYTITLTNNAFKDAAAMEVKYLVFVERQRAGEKTGNEHIERVTGTKAVEGIKSHQKTSVETDKFTLNQNQLAAGWHYTNGGKTSAKDSVKGVWVRVYQGGTVIGEYVNPSTIRTREKWEE